MKSIWQETAEIPPFPTLTGKHRTDVLIIGGGMAGVLTAFLLRQKGVPCVLLEKERICGGTTAGTTAKNTIQHGLIYHKLLQKSRLQAEQYLRANLAAFQQLTALCRQADCDFVERDNYIYACSDRRKLEHELEALSKIGYPASFCAQLPLPLPTVGAVRFAQQGQFHPLKFAAAVSKGLPIYEHSGVRELRGMTAVTAQGEVTARHIVVTTHFPFLNRHGSYFLKLYQHRSYVLALENAQKLDGMYLDESGSGLSFRNYENYLLLGGGSHRTGKQGGGWNELRGFARTHYPQAREAYFWAAQDCMSLDGLPYIGQYSARTGQLFTATGFQKWGMTGSMLSAMLLTDLLLGNRNEFAALFCPSRSILHPQLLRNGLEAAKSLLTISPRRCPHLGCALHWNAAEHSWDCACHGSRFDENGRVLENPANGNLKR